MLSYLNFGFQDLVDLISAFVICQADILFYSENIQVNIPLSDQNGYAVTCHSATYKQHLVLHM